MRLVGPATNLCVLLRLEILIPKFLNTRSILGYPVSRPPDGLAAVSGVTQKLLSEIAHGVLLTIKDQAVARNEGGDFRNGLPLIVHQKKWLSILNKSTASKLLQFGLRSLAATDACNGPANSGRCGGR